ncbi:MAG: type II toxin-antitoxin system RelE/ParE family toxin [Rhodocyclaceae bacterium]|nr:type II toxin-antitoxin system RelE/ParE family toxin [Rhodocyclaceae bacterium]
MPASRRLEWSASAEREYHEALAYIAANSGETNALRVAGRVERAESLIAANPLIGSPGRRAGTREHPIARTGHTLIYRVTASHITIIRFLHQRMNFRK